MNLARIKFLSMILVAMIEGRCVNMARLCGLINSPACQASIYKRLQRFMKEVAFFPKQLAPLLLNIMLLHHQEKLLLILDRTNWKFGKTHCNILYLAVAYKGIAVPLIWVLLEDKKQGNSDHFDRLDLLEFFITIFGKARIDCVMGDREFIGKHWVEWLKSEKIPYNLRIKESGQYIANAQGNMVKPQLLFGFLKPNQYVNLGRRKIGKTEGYESFVSAIRSSTGELVVLIHCSTISDPCELYRQRWQIEVLFRAIKTGGFNLEDTHITDFDRLDTLLGIVAIACCLAYRMRSFNELCQPHNFIP